VLADRVIERGWVAFADGRIAEYGEGIAPSGSEDAGGDLIMPGLIELHTDHLEMHYVPASKGVLGSDRGGGFLRRAVGHLGHHDRAGFACGSGARMAPRRLTAGQACWRKRSHPRAMRTCFAPIISCTCAANPDAERGRRTKELVDRPDVR